MIILEIIIFSSTFSHTIRSLIFLTFHLNHSLFGKFAAEKDVDIFLKIISMASYRWWFCKFETNCTGGRSFKKSLVTIYIVHGYDLLTQLISIKFEYQTDEFLKQSCLNAQYKFLT